MAHREMDRSCTACAAVADAGVATANPGAPPADRFHALFTPGSIVVVGASESLLKPGGKVMRNIIDHAYQGDLWAVNPRADTIFGLPAFKTIADLPGRPDLAIIAVPAPSVAPALEDLSRRGTRAVIILTAGFGEKDARGKAEEQRLLAIAERAGMTLIGPNCSGFMTPAYNGKFAGIVPEIKPAAVDFISGSGATVDCVMENAVHRGLAFCTVVNVGNSIQMGVEDILALYAANYSPGGAAILLLYLEAVNKPQLLLQHARGLTQKGCTVVAIKSGVTAAGARAAASHTGALATDDAAVEALFRKAGIIRLRSKAEMIDVACVLAALKGRPAGKRVCVVTDAGGPGVMLTDELERQGLELPLLGEKTQARLSEILPPESAKANPVDCLPTRTAAQIRAIFHILAEEEKGRIDVIAIQVANPGMSDNPAIYREVAGAMEDCPIPVIPVLSSTTTCAGPIGQFAAAGRSYFQDEVPLGAALGAVVRQPRLFAPGPPPPGYDPAGVKTFANTPAGPLPPAMAAALLGRAGFRLPFQVEVFSEEGLEPACQKVGYPVVMKVMGPLHKSDRGGVRLGIRDLAAARKARTALMALPEALGVLVQPMVEGLEVILGASRTEGFGHLVMVGLGGIYAETLKDIRFALAPLASEEALDMIRGLKCYPILQGMRGQKGISIEFLAEQLARLSWLVTDLPRIREIDLNPVKGFGTELYAVDARVVIG